MLIPGLGTIINVAAIVVAGLLGTAAGRFLNERLQDGLAKADSCAACEMLGIE